MRLKEGLDVLDISTEGSDALLHPVLLRDENTTILVDAGLPGQAKIIREAVEKAGAVYEKLDRIIITHQDMDHIGSLADIQRELGESLEVMSHPEERPYIEFEKRPVKMTPERMAQIGAAMAGSGQGSGGSLKEVFSHLKSRITATVEDGEELPYCGGITVIHMPGHTPGHICLYLKKYKTLVAGDALNVVEGGRLVGPNPRYTPDMEQALKSLEKLLQYEIETVVCYHGGVYSDNAGEKLAELAEAGFDAYSDAYPIPPQESLPPNPNLPRNESGETYGEGKCTTPYEKRPDLIKAVGVDGTVGYIRVSEADGEMPKTPEEALALQAKRDKQGVRYINLYESDGKTVIGKFSIGSGNGGREQRH